MSLTPTETDIAWATGYEAGYKAGLTRIRAAEADLVRARKALEPFAAVLDDFDPADEDDFTPGTFVAGSVTDYSLTLGDFRLASRSLGPLPDEEADRG